MDWIEISVPETKYKKGQGEQMWKWCDKHAGPFYFSWNIEYKGNSHSYYFADPMIAVRFALKWA